MKKYILPGMLVAMALSLPLAAQAQMSPSINGGQAAPVITQPSTAPSSTYGQSLKPAQTPSGITNPYSSQYQPITPSQMGAQTQNQAMPSSQIGTPPATGVSNQQPSVTQTQSTVSQTQTTTSTVANAISPNPISGEVIVGTDAATSTVPPLQIGMGTTVITVVNPTPKPVSFSVPALNMTYDVPANTQRTIQIDRTQTANLTPGQVIAYYINDSSGNQIATSSLTEYVAVVSQINTDTTVATEQKTEPTYTSSKYSRTPRRSTVRGYW